MGFWDEHAQAEATHAKAEEARTPRRPTSQNAPDDCVHCGHSGTDVLLGSCRACHEAWEEGS